MSTAITHADSPFGPPPPDLRFLYDAKRTENSAMMLLQWCLGENIRTYLKEFAKKEETFLLVSVVDPTGREERYLFDTFTGYQGIIEFHRPGVHRIYGQVFWGMKRKIAEGRLLRKVARYQYERSLNYILSNKTFSSALIEVDAPKGDYYAKEPSPKMEWWINLWFREPWWDYCQLTRRKVLAFTVQPPLVGLYVAFMTLFRFILAFWSGIMLARRGINWSAVIHPFTYGWRDVRSGEGGNSFRFQKRWGSGLYFDKSGKSRGFGGALLCCFIPLPHLVLFVAVAAVHLFSLNQKKLPTIGAFLTDSAWNYLLILGGIVAIAIGIGIIICVSIAAAAGLDWILGKIDEEYPVGTVERRRFFSRARWIAFLGLVAIVYYLNHGEHPLVAIGMLPKNWATDILRALIAPFVWMAVFAAMLYGFQFLPEPKKRLVKSTLHDGFTAMGEDLEDGVEYLLEQRRRRAENRRQEERRQAALLYDQFACEQAPATGSGIRDVSAMPIAVPTVTRFKLKVQQHKLDTCRPRARL